MVAAVSSAKQFIPIKVHQQMLRWTLVLVDRIELTSMSVGLLGLVFSIHPLSFVLFGISCNTNRPTEGERGGGAEWDGGSLYYIK